MLEQLEATQKQLAKALEVNEKQAALIAAYEKQEGLLQKEIESLRAALDAERAARALDQQKLSNAEARLKEMQEQFARLKKKSKWGALGSFAIGFAVGAAVSGGGGK